MLNKLLFSLWAISLHLDLSIYKIFFLNFIIHVFQYTRENFYEQPFYLVTMGLALARTAHVREDWPLRNAAAEIDNLIGFCERIPLSIFHKNTQI